jgi:hypothetical protein
VRALEGAGTRMRNGKLRKNEKCVMDTEGDSDLSKGGLGFHRKNFRGWDLGRREDTKGIHI